MLERWKQGIDIGQYISVMYMDLPKPFNTINTTSALDLLSNYLKDRKQKAVMNNKTVSSEVVVTGVPQGSTEQTTLCG